MAFTPNNQTKAIESINSAVKYGHLTPEQGKLIKTICTEVKVPAGTLLYIGFDAFCEFLSQAIPYTLLLINSRSIFREAYSTGKMDDIRKGIGTRESMNAFRTTISKVPKQVSAIISLNRDIPNITLVNSIGSNKFYNRTKDMEDIANEIIHPKAAAALLGITAVSTWKNPTLAIVTKKGMSIYVPFTYLHTFVDSAISTNTHITFNFFHIEENIESKTLIIEPHFLALAKNVTKLKELLCEYGFMDSNWTIAKVEVLNFFTTSTVTIVNVP